MTFLTFINISKQGILHLYRPPFNKGKITTFFHTTNFLTLFKICVKLC